MIITLIAAMSENRVIGAGGKLPWHIPEDLARFKKITKGHMVIMGRKTYESIGHPLPDRFNIILSRSIIYDSVDGCLVARNLKYALEAGRTNYEHEIFILGGAEVFREALPLAHRIYLTVIHKEYEGDVFFPELPEHFLEIHREELSGADPPCSLLTFEKVEPVEAGADARDLCKKGHAALERELFYLARSCFEQAAALSGTPETTSFLAYSLAKSTGDFMNALKLAQDALDREPGNPTLYLNLGRVQVLAGQKERGIETFRAGLKAGGGEDLIDALETYNPRPQPVINTLSRSNPLNKYLGKLLHRLGKQ